MASKSQQALRIVANELHSQRVLLTKVLDITIANHDMLTKLVKANEVLEISQKDQGRRIAELERDNRGLRLRLQRFEETGRTT